MVSLIWTMSLKYSLFSLRASLIEYFFLGKEYLMKAHFFLPSVDGDLTEGKPPINVKFEIPYFTTSGIQVSRNSIELKTREA